MPTVLTHLPLETLAAPARMEKLFARIDKAKTGKRLADSFRGSGGTSGFDNQMRGHAAFHVSKNRILLQPFYDDDYLLACLLHELGHAAQTKQGIGMHAANSPQQNLALNRFLEAHADAGAVIALRQLAETGDCRPLSAYESESFHKGLSGKTLPGLLLQWHNSAHRRDTADHQGLCWLEGIASGQSPQGNPLAGIDIAETASAIMGAEYGMSLQDFKVFQSLPDDMSPQNRRWLERFLSRHPDNPAPQKRHSSPIGNP